MAIFILFFKISRNLRQNIPLTIIFCAFWRNFAQKKKKNRWSQLLVHKCCVKAILLPQIGIVFTAQHSKPAASRWRGIKVQHLFGG
jgi:hypothetical protein